VPQAGRNAKILPGSSHGLRSTPGYSRTGPPLARPPLMGSLRPYSVQKVTGSDQHRAYHTRLCSACGFSQPLDALLLPKPLRLCFTPVTLMGFALQRLSLPTSRRRLSTRLALLTFWSASPSPPGVRAFRSEEPPTRARAPKPSAQVRPATRCFLRPLLASEETRCHRALRRTVRTRLQGCKPDRESVRPVGGG
jgi:hypothetical protein